MILSVVQMYSSCFSSNHSLAYPDIEHIHIVQISASNTTLEAHIAGKHQPLNNYHE